MMLIKSEVEHGNAASAEARQPEWKCRRWQEVAKAWEMLSPTYSDSREGSEPALSAMQRP